jgi:1-acyl-sn-glycerol-3-phosphate acyltransferase
MASPNVWHDVRLMRAVWKIFRGLWHLMVGLLTIYLRFPQLAPEQREMRVQAWSLQLLALWGIHLRVIGLPVRSGPALIVSNHISWLDILVIHATRYCRFVSKSDIKSWPVVGALATGAGTLYIQRASRRDASRMVRDMAQSMRAGDVVAVFPEGTTGDGTEVLPFHANLIESAILAGAPVQPMALRFVDTRSGTLSQAPCYIGDDTLIGSVWRTLTADPITAVVCFGEPQHANGRNRRQWSQDLRTAVMTLRARD